MKWTFWVNMVSPHMAPFLRVLASMPDHSVTIVAEDAMNAERTSLGWQMPNCGAARVITRPCDVEIAELVRKTTGPGCVHLFGGWRNVALNRRVLPQVAQTGALVGLMSEAADGDGWKGGIRRILYRLEKTRLAPRLDLILALGEFGGGWV